MTKPKQRKSRKPKMGPPFRAGVRATNVLTIRLTAAERTAFERAAGERTISMWARDVLTRAARRAP